MNPKITLMIRILIFITLSLAFFSTIACSPKFYLIDRQTVLEDEAAGEWPEFEKEILDKSKSAGPTPFPKIDNGTTKNRLFQVLNGEMTSKIPSEKK